MGNANYQFTIFTKPWPELPLPELARFVKDMGFDGVELPVRPGFQVTPETMARGLPEAARILADYGLKIGSVAGPATCCGAGSQDEATIAACGNSGVPILRICVGIDMNIGYFATEKRLREQYDALVPVLDKHKVTLGIQNHCGNCVGSAIGIMHLIEKYDPRHIGAVLDLAHCGLDGEPDAMGIDIVWSHLVLVNLKSAYWRRVSGPEAQEAKWDTYWTDGRHGLTSWPTVAKELIRRGYKGDICLPAEYTATQEVERLAQQDLLYAKSLFQGGD